MPLFNSETAAEFGRRGQAARIAAEARRAEEVRRAAEAPPAADYTERRLSRVRVQLDLVDTRIAAEAAKAVPDGQVLNWLCSAQQRLSDQEFDLANRPKPGSRKLLPERPTARRYMRYTEGPQPEPVTDGVSPMDLKT